MTGLCCDNRTVTFADEVRSASARLTGVADRTPLELNPRLSAATGANVWLKREDLQLGRSYKVRGAYNLISQLHAAERAAGAVCASAGNHGQGVAIACRALGVHGRVYVPGTTMVSGTPPSWSSTSTASVACPTMVASASKAGTSVAPVTLAYSRAARAAAS